MNVLSNFHFIRPLGLLLLPVVVGIWWFVQRHNDPLRVWRSTVEPELLAAITLRPKTERAWRNGATLIAWLMAALAIAGPSWRPEPSPFADDPVPVMVLLKAGQSMSETDLVPSRMERARLKVVDFCQERRGQPIGLIAYAGTAHLVLPPTRDTEVVGAMATEIDPSIMPQAGDELTRALELAAAALGTDGGSILVVADRITRGAEQELAEFQTTNRGVVQVLGVARSETPEEDDLQRAATALGATLTLLTPDGEDVRAIARRAASAPVAVAAADQGTRWAEAGWWLVPLIAVLVLSGFRRQESKEPSVP